MSDPNRDIIESQMLVDAIQVRQAKSAKYQWRLADLTARNTHSNTKGELRNSTLTLEEWNKKIGWTERGFKLQSLKQMVAEARAWPTSLRIADHGFWRHFEARAMFKGDVQAAHDWLLGRTGNITEQARAGVVTPLHEAVMHLIKARRRIMQVPPLLSEIAFQGTENELRQLTREVEAIERAVVALRRFLADEAEINTEELESAIDRILSGEEAS